jgi:hypothetical protein
VIGVLPRWPSPLGQVSSSVYAKSPGWPSQTAQFTATVSNTSNAAVTWAVAPANGGAIDPNGLYAAPNAGRGLRATVKIAAISRADPAKIGIAAGSS